MEIIKLTHEGPISIITIDRPKALNALNQQAIAELELAIAEAAVRTEMRALIVTGGGEKAFVAGADIAAMAQFTPQQALAMAAAGHRAFAALESLHVPVIAAVNGFALGGGLELALSCDFIYASEKAKLALPEVTLAVLPGWGGTQRLARLVGKARAKELIFSGEMIDAAKAKEIGLVLEVFAPDQLMAKCKEMATKFAARGPLAIASAKRVIERGYDVPLTSATEAERQAFAALFGSEDQKEGMKAFLEKRQPNYQGK